MNGNVKQFSRYRPSISVMDGIRVNYPVPVHHASTRPLGTKKLPVLNLEMLETSMMA